MAITISGANNVDKILATDGVLDSISGFNVVGVMTAGTFDVTGKTTTGHLNIGSNIQIGNAGIITATTLIGNVTGNINHTSNLLLQISGSEKFRVGTSGQLGIGGANYGSSGQVLTSGGSGSAATWSTIASDKITEGNTEAEVVDTGSDGHFKVTTEGSERLRVSADGNVTVGAAVTISPVGNINATGIITATSFVGSGANLTSLPAANLTGTLPAISGANLTSLPAQATIANNADNRVITGGSGVNLNGEANLVFDGTRLGIGESSPEEELHITAATPVIRLEDSDTSRQSQIVGIDGNLRFDADNGNAQADTNISFRTDGTERLRITSTGLLLGGSDASNNTTLGGNAGDSIASGGTSNTLIGKDAGTAITTGDSHTALGYLALSTISTESGCVAVGSNALQVCTGADNLGIGFAAGQQVSTGTNNLLLGSSAGLSIQAGTHNIAIGRDALRLGSNSNVNYNVVAGNYSLNQLTNAYNNVVIGYNCSGSGTMTGSGTWHSNVVIGYQAGNNAPTTASNIVIGKYTCHNAGTSHSDNIIIGRNAGRYLGNNSNNIIAIGAEAAQNTGYGPSSNHAYSWSHSIAIGYRSFMNATGAPDAVVAVGPNTLREHNGDGDGSSGGYICAMGQSALATCEHMRHSVAIGNDSAAYWNPAKGNQHEGGGTFVGGGAGRYQGTATACIAVGRDALNSSSSNPASGSNNTGIGARALEKLTSGSHNVCVSSLYGALFVDTGSWNTFMGSLAGYGYDTNNSCRSGNYCTQIGAYSKSSGASNDYESCFGYGITGKGANTTHIRGSAYNSNNSSSWSTTSDERIKKNIVDNNIGLDAIEKIRVRNFEYRTKNEITDFDNTDSVVVKKEGVQIGVIAQEIKDILPDVVKQNTTGAYAVDPDNLTWYLVNAVKELSAEVKSLKAQINS